MVLYDHRAAGMSRNEFGLEVIKLGDLLNENQLLWISQTFDDFYSTKKYIDKHFFFPPLRRNLRNVQEICQFVENDYDFNKKKYRYAYGVGMDLANGMFYKIYKNDLQNKTVLCIEAPDEQYSEPVFVPRPGSVDEDDGVILSMVFKDKDPNFTALLILDGKTFEECARVQFRTSGPVTGTLHGIFKPNNSSERVFV